MAEQPLFDAAFLKQLEYLKLVARRQYRYAASGEHASPKRGSSLEFADYRHYQPGDDYRYIDWHIFSRLEHLFVKLFSAEEDLTIHLLIDTSGSMGVGEPSKLVYACRLAVALGYIALSSHDRVGLATFADQLDGGPAPKRNRQHIFTLMEHCNLLGAAGDTAFNDALARYAHRSRRPGLAFVLSDLLDGAGYEAGLRALRFKRFDIVLIQVLHPQELEAPVAGPLLLRDIESDRTRRVYLDAALLSAYEQRLQDYFRGLARFCLKNNIEYLRTSTDVPFDSLILKYLRRGLHLRS